MKENKEHAKAIGIIIIIGLIIILQMFQDSLFEKSIQLLTIGIVIVFGFMLILKGREKIREQDEQEEEQENERRKRREQKRITRRTKRV